MFAIQREEVVNFMKQHGPIVPTDLRKRFGVDTFIIGAVLSELSSRGIIKISNLKKGSSPFYFLPGQEEQLEKFTEYLNEKDARTLNWLKEVKVAEDEHLETLKRVSLRKIPDFAKPLKAKMEDGTEVLFWRYFSFPEEEAIKLLKGEEEKAEAVLPDTNLENVVVEREQPIQTHLIEKEIQKEKEDTLLEQKAQKPSEDLKEKITNTKVQIPDPSFKITPFYEKSIEYFREHEITIVKQKEVSKKEYEFLIKVPSNVGEIIMLSRAKDKKKLNEGDVAPALLAAKMIDVSCLFLVTGDFTKKSQQEMDKLYTGLIVKKLN